MGNARRIARRIVAEGVGDDPAARDRAIRQRRTRLDEEREQADMDDPVLNPSGRRWRTCGECKNSFEDLPGARCPWEGHPNHYEGGDLPSLQK